MSPGCSKKQILVVGDWIVDDHWVLNVHRSSTSSRTGRRHLRSAHSTHDSTESLCGAGRTASILYQSLSSNYEVVGIGVCTPPDRHDRATPADQDVLLSMMVAEGLSEKSPHSLRRWNRAHAPEGARFFNLGHKDSGTARAIRIWERRRTRVELTERIDWETDLNVDDLTKRFKDHFASKIQREEVAAVVIKDLGKGVADAVVPQLTGELGDVPWFISTKVADPAWRCKLKDVTVRLYLVPEIAATQILRGSIDNRRESPFTSWIIEGHRPSSGALKYLQQHEKTPFENVVVLPTQATVLAWQKNEKSNAKSGNSFVLTHEPHPVTVPLPRASVLLGALTAQMMTKESVDFRGLVEQSSAFTESWREHESRRVNDPSNYRPKAENVFDTKTWETQKNLPQTQPFNLESELGDWQRAFDFNELRGKAESIEVWRSTTEIPDYVCVVPSKRRSLARLLILANDFVNSDRTRNASCLLVAPPGSGKTHLVQCLASFSGFRVLSFDIATLQSTDDLLSCFDRIATAQIEDPGAPFLVFVDEVNAKLENAAVYRHFLTVLDQSVYYRAANALHLRPCLWLFAGTESLGGSKPSSKGPDFQSRLTGGEISLRGQDDEEEACKIEMVYAGISLIRRRFPEVQNVGRSLLWFLASYGKDLGLRNLGRLVDHLHDVKAGQVDLNNLPWTRLIETLEQVGMSLTRETIETNCRGAGDILVKIDESGQLGW